MNVDELRDVNVGNCIDELPLFAREPLLGNLVKTTESLVVFRPLSIPEDDCHLCPDESPQFPLYSLESRNVLALQNRHVVEQNLENFVEWLGFDKVAAPARGNMFVS